ncbi:hypothetical protein H072_2319 [Dactylellina haptotyla CBS 200.50]|uniref:Uncharacterized protein n=1 Tax=Dactylellina haptotyla (strain CBS 200.50) TaxID=1284197 RepID=S8AL76_DACHA|nr:hypothetical protein H072_2319 [Dactylellina haptotyla CBS 200.50]
MPSFASFSSSPLAIGKGKAHKSYPPVSMKAPSLPETPHLDTSDLLYSVQSVPSPLSPPLDSRQELNPEYQYQDHNNPPRPAWHTSDPYQHGEPGFVGGHQYKVERQEERRRLRSLGLLSGASTPQSELSNTYSAMTTTSTSQKPDARRRSSWQPPLKGKLQKRNKSKEPEQGRMSLDTKHASIDFPSLPPPPPQQQQQQQHHHSFSRLQTYASPTPGGSQCTTPSGMTPTRELMHPNPPFAHSGRSQSSLGTMSSAATLPSPSLGNLVDFYDPNSPLLSPGQAFSTAPSSPVVPLNSQVSSQSPSPIGFHRPRYNQVETTLNTVGISPLIAAQNMSNSSVTSGATAKKPIQRPKTPTSGANASSSSVNTTSSLKGFEKQSEGSSSQPYQPKYAAKSHVTSTVPFSQTANQDSGATPFVHLDFAPPPKPFARQTAESRKSTSSETRLTTQEAKEYQAIAQATREAYITRNQTPSDITATGKSNGRPPLAPSKLSFEVKSASAPDAQGGKSTVLPPKSILRKPVEPVIEDVKNSEEPSRRQTFSNSVQMPPNLIPEPLRIVSNPMRSEPVSPITLNPQPERGRPTFKRGEEESGAGVSRKSSTSARKSIDVENPSAKNFDISKYTQAGPSKPSQSKAQKSYPPISYKRPAVDPSLSTEPSVSAPQIPPIPPVPPLPESLQDGRGLSTPPPIRYDNAIESSDEESIDRPSTASEAKRTGKSRLSSGVSLIEDGPVRPRAPSMSEILKDFYKPGTEDTSPSEVTENPDWLSQLFRTKKSEAKARSRPTNIMTTPPSSFSPPLSKYTMKENDSRRSSRQDLSLEGQKVHERAERQRLEVERKLMEAETEPNLTPRSSPRFPRPSVSVTASPDLRVVTADTSSLRSASTTSVDRLDPVVGGSLNLGRVEEIPSTPSTSSLEEKKPVRKRRPTSAEVRQQLGEMTPPHEREDWEVTRNSQANLSNINLPQTQTIASTPASPSIPAPTLPLAPPAPLVVNKPVSGRLPVGIDSTASASAPTRGKEPFGLGLVTKPSNSSLLGLDVTKTLTKILVVCCTCHRLHDPPSDIYRQMAQGNTEFRCPYCIHPINVQDCCSAYTSICNLIEKIN